MRVRLRSNYFFGLAEMLAVQDFDSSYACACGKTRMTCTTGSGRLLMVKEAIIVKTGLLDSVQASVQSTATGAVTDQ